MTVKHIDFHVPKLPKYLTVDILLSRYIRTKILQILYTAIYLPALNTYFYLFTS